MSIKVIVEEGLNKTRYPLDENLIAFGVAVENKDFQGAVEILEPLDVSAPEILAMWKELSIAAMTDRSLLVAEKCYCILGNYSKVRLPLFVSAGVSTYD